MKTMRFAAAVVAALALVAMARPDGVWGDPPPPPLPTHNGTPPTVGNPAIETTATDTEPTPMPPPPLPTHPTATDGTAPVTSSQPSITSVTILHRVNGRLTTTRKLLHGESARFVMAWRIQPATAKGISAELVIQKAGKTIYHRSMHAKNGSHGGTFWTDLRLRAQQAIGKLIADFRLTLGVHRSLSFTVVQPAKAKNK